MKFRNLRADEIECRVSRVTENGVDLLLYKDARCDMRILDETVGPEYWQREPFECKGVLYCRVSIYSKNIGEWVSKSDCGTESSAEAKKGESSDSFKRACFNWGIGRELYTAPRIWIPASQCEIKQGRNGKHACYDKFEVESIRTVDDRIVHLSISKNGRVVYKHGLTEDDVLKQAKARANRAMKGYAAHEGIDVNQLIEDMKNQPGFGSNPEFFEKIAKTYEDALTNAVANNG